MKSSLLLDRFNHICFQVGLASLVRSDWLYKASHHALSLTASLSPRREYTPASVSHRNNSSNDKDSSRTSYFQYLVVNISISAVLTPLDTPLHAKLLSDLIVMNTSIHKSASNAAVNPTTSKTVSAPPLFCRPVLISGQTADLPLIRESPADGNSSNRKVRHKLRVRSRILRPK